MDTLVSVMAQAVPVTLGMLAAGGAFGRRSRASARCDSPSTSRTRVSPGCGASLVARCSYWC